MLMAYKKLDTRSLLSVLTTQSSGATHQRRGEPVVVTVLLRLRGENNSNKKIALHNGMVAMCHREYCEHDK